MLYLGSKLEEKDLDQTYGGDCHFVIFPKHHFSPLCKIMRKVIFLEQTYLSININSVENKELRGFTFLKGKCKILFNLMTKCVDLPNSLYIDFLAPHSFSVGVMDFIQLNKTEDGTPQNVQKVLGSILSATKNKVR